jgi:hypothetical protein
MYVDESGDPGLVGSPTEHFLLTGLVVHELDWRRTLERLLDFRRRMNNTFGLLWREEIHCSTLLSRPGDLVRIKRNDRLTIIRGFANELASMTHLRIVCVHVDKRSKQADYDVFRMAWKALIQRFANTIASRNFPRASLQHETGMIFPDRTDEARVERLLGKMRRFNPIPNRAEYARGYRNIPLDQVIEYPSFRDSHRSQFIQAADLAAFLMYQELAPSAYMRRKGAQSYSARLTPILCDSASRTDPRGIVRL